VRLRFGLAASVVTALTASVLWAGSAGADSSGQRLWTARYDGPSHADDRARSIAASADGASVYVTGTSSDDIATVGYDAATGARRWSRRYDGTPGGIDEGEAVTVSPDGTAVFVTGGTADLNDPSTLDYATVAYNAASGAVLWASRYDGPGHSDDESIAITTSPDGSRVFVTGQSVGAGSSDDYATVAFNASTGARLWVARYNGTGNDSDAALAIAVTPDGARLIVTGTSVGLSSGLDYATLAYDTASGAQLWARRYKARAQGDDIAHSVASSPDGATAYVTGASDGSDRTERDFATVAYDTVTGATRWVSRFSSPGAQFDGGSAVAVSPSGGRLFVTGVTRDDVTGTDFATLAYNAATGARVWASRYNGPGDSADQASSISVGPDGSALYVAGTSFSATGGDYATVAYTTASGAQLWVRRHDGPAGGNDSAASVVTTADRVFVTGQEQGALSVDYATLAYLR
jgi:hypothetical protein